MQLSKHFKRYEMACRCGRCDASRSPKVKPALMALLELCRMYVKQQDPKGYLLVSCGVRCPVHNRKVKGKKRSRHLTGEAADIVPRGHNIDLKIMYDYLCALFPNSFGLGLYLEDGFIHVDIRAKRARW